MTIERTATFPVRPEGLDRALEAIRRFGVHTVAEPGTSLYVSWRSELCPHEFLHFMSFADAEAEQPHASSDGVHASTEMLYPLCLAPPTFGEWHEVRERGSQGAS